jgi:precorrin-8X/cobalt-precorrin-8 methylmutase
MAMSYLRDPAEIYRESWRAVTAATDLSGVPPELHQIALRIVHAAADPSLAALLRGSTGAATAARQAMAVGAPILCDAEMVASGITPRFLPAKNAVRCSLNDPTVPALAERLATTRAAAAVELWRPHLDGAVIAIGNAPTALFHLLDLLRDGAPRPAIVLGFAVGFVGAEEAKAALMAQSAVPWIALAGRRGGSALAAAAVNALALDATDGGA